MFIAWNPVNFVDGESGWIVRGTVYVFLGIVLSQALSLLLRFFSKKTPSFGLFSAAFLRPAVCLIWYLVALYSIDLVTEGWISEMRPKLWAFVTSGSSVLALGWFLFRLKDRLIEAAAQRRVKDGKAPDATSMQALSKLLTVGIFAVVLILLNDFTGMSLTTLLAFSGVGGLALAFASQEIVSNFFGGLMIHMTRPFLIGEIVQMPSLSIEGVIEEIGWYQTCIRPASKAAVYIPNSLFTKTPLVNKSRITHRLLEVSTFIAVQPLDALSAIVQDVNAYLSSHPEFDRTEWAGARIECIGPTSTIVFSALTKTYSLQDFYRLKDEVLLKVSHIVASHGGKEAMPPQLLLPARCEPPS